MLMGIMIYTVYHGTYQHGRQVHSAGSRLGKSALALCCSSILGVASFPWCGAQVWAALATVSYHGASDPSLLGMCSSGYVLQSTAAVHLDAMSVNIVVGKFTLAVCCSSILGVASFPRCGAQVWAALAIVFVAPPSLHGMCTASVCLHPLSTCLLNVMGDVCHDVSQHRREVH